MKVKRKRPPKFYCAWTRKNLNPKRCRQQCPSCRTWSKHGN